MFQEFYMTDYFPYDKTVLWCRHAPMDWKPCVFLWACEMHPWISGAGGLLFNWESAGLCRRTLGMCIVKLYFSFVLVKCWCKGRGSEKLKDWGTERRRGGKRTRKKDLDCIIDYPITSATLQNYPPLSQEACRTSGAPHSCSAAHIGWRVTLWGEKNDGQVKKKGGTTAHLKQERKQNYKASCGPIFNLCKTDFMHSMLLCTEQPVWHRAKTLNSLSLIKTQLGGTEAWVTSGGLPSKCTLAGTEHWQECCQGAVRWWSYFTRRRVG